MSLTIVMFVALVWDEIFLLSPLPMTVAMGCISVARSVSWQSVIEVGVMFRRVSSCWSDMRSFYIGVFRSCLACTSTGLLHVLWA